jgi:hypothetical protein
VAGLFLGSPAASAEAFVPGLGEIMGLQQMRHVKLWFAGQPATGSSRHELDELVRASRWVKFHPTHKDSPVALRTSFLECRR